MQSLYHLSIDYQLTLDNLTDMLEAGDIDQQAFNDTLEGAEGELKDKAIAVAAYIKNLQAHAASIKEAEKDMTARRKAAETKVKNLTDYLMANIKALDTKEIKSPQFDIKIKKKPLSVIVNCETSSLPMQYINRKVTETPNKTELKGAILAGLEIDGVELVAGERLEIK